jgi:deazaflavin-dependent oxidoreductase (nitroreductase family)
MRERNRTIIAGYRETGGKDENMAALVLLTTTGSVSGNAHTTPVCVREDGDDLVVAGSMGGMAKHPQWYRNLSKTPELTVEYQGETYQAQAVTLENSPDRDRLFQMMSEVIPGLYGYQDKCRNQRQIPIVRLVRA